MSCELASSLSRAAKKAPLDGHETIPGPTSACLFRGCDSIPSRDRSLIRRSLAIFCCGQLRGSSDNRRIIFSRSLLRISLGEWLIRFYPANASSSNVKDDAAFVLQPPAPDVRHPLNSTSRDDRRDNRCARVRICDTRETLRSVLWHLEMSCRRLNREARHLSSHRYYVDITKILRTQATVRECSDSEDDEVDNDSPSNDSAPTSDSGTLSSWDAASCTEFTAVHYSSEGLNIRDRRVSGNIFDTGRIKCYVRLLIQLFWRRIFKWRLEIRLAWRDLVKLRDLNLCLT